MNYDPQIHHRRSVRLRGYDYSRAAAYFITICTYKRETSLDAKQVQDVVRSAWYGLPDRFPNVTLDECVVMSNHLHAIIILEDAASSRGAASTGAASGAPTLGAVVRALKSVSAIGANNLVGQPGRPFWQRNYYEHVIRDEDELNAVRQYIRDNPLNWHQDPDNPANL